MHYYRPSLIWVAVLFFNPLDLSGEAPKWLTLLAYPLRPCWHIRPPSYTSPCNIANEEPGIDCTHKINCGCWWFLGEVVIVQGWTLPLRAGLTDADWCRLMLLPLAFVTIPRMWTAQEMFCWGCLYDEGLVEMKPRLRRSWTLALGSRRKTLLTRQMSCSHAQSSGCSSGRLRL